LSGTRKQHLVVEMCKQGRLCAYSNHNPHVTGWRIAIMHGMALHTSIYKPCTQG